LKFSWHRELINTLAFFLIIIILGIFSQKVTLVLLFGTGIYLSWQIINLFYLLHWIETGMSEHLPKIYGIWAELLYYVFLLQNRARKRKRKMSRFLRRFQEVAAALPDAALILGRKGEIEWCNIASKKLLGLEPNRISGHFLIHLIRQPALAEYLERNDYAQAIEIVSPVEETRMLSCQIHPIGKKYQRLLIIRDVTQMQLIDQVRRDFVANVSHELRTPLTVLRGFLETLGDANTECPEWARSIELMGQQAARMDRIVNDLLILSRLELGEDLSSNSESVAVPELLNSILSEARMLSGAQAHTFTVKIDSNLWIWGSAEELRSAFSNLIFNAVQHTPAHTQINIEWQIFDNQAVFTVMDNGEGIPARHLPRLTERFYRVDKARSRSRGGTGLGLAIVKHVLTRHGGVMSVKSDLGVGSVFACTLPESRVYRHGGTSEAKENFSNL